MKIKEGFKLRTLENEHVVLPEGVVNFNKMVFLNRTAAFLWEKVEGKDFTIEDLTDLLVENYEVDEETAAKDAKALADKWTEAGLIAE